jgi:tetratricopeptide (TPR) repeat protein
MHCVLLAVAVSLLPMLRVGAQGPRAGESEILRRGAELEERGDLGQAQAVYLDGLRRHPRSGEISLRLGTVFLREGNWAEAIRHLGHASEMRPGHVDTLYYLAQAYYLDGQHARAGATIRRAATLAPDRADVAQKYGEYLCELKACQEGLRHLQKAQRLDPSLPNIEFDLGMAHHRLASLTDARQHLEAALARDPDNLVAARFLADVLQRNTESQRARDLYAFVVARDPRNAWALYGLGQALIALDRPQEALSPLRRALELDATIARAHYQLGRALRLLGRDQEARDEWDLFRALRERQEGPRRPVTAERTSFEERIWEECRRLLDQNGESEALAYLDSILEGSGYDPHYLLGTLYFNLGRGPDAVRLLSWASAISPEDADALAFLGRAYVLQGDYDRADETLARAVALRPDGELPLVGRGELEYARQRWAEAIPYFEKSKTAQVPVLLKLCRSYLLTDNRAKGLETAKVARALAKGDPALLRELDSVLGSDNESAAPAKIDRSP